MGRSETLETQENEFTPEPDFFAVVVNQTHWICEGVLWTEWYHCGDLYAKSDCTFISINPDRFGHVMRGNEWMDNMAKTYAVNYVEHLNNIDVDELSDIGGVDQPQFDWQTSDGFISKDRLLRRTHRTTSWLNGRLVTP